MRSTSFMLLPRKSAYEVAATVWPAEPGAAQVETLLLHLIQLIEPIDVGHNRFHELLETVGGKSLFAHLLRQAGGRLGQRCHRHTCEEVVQEFQFESATDGLWNDGNTRIGEELRRILYESMKTGRPHLPPQC